VSHTPDSYLLEGGHIVISPWTARTGVCLEGVKDHQYRKEEVLIWNIPGTCSEHLLDLRACFCFILFDSFRICWSLVHLFELSPAGVMLGTRGGWIRTDRRLWNPQRFRKHDFVFFIFVWSLVSKSQNILEVLIQIGSDRCAIAKGVVSEDAEGTKVQVRLTEGKFPDSRSGSSTEMVYGDLRCGFF
jgi:hypothetical protein